MRELQRITLGHDPTGNARDRLSTRKELLKLERKGTTSVLEASSAADLELQQRWAGVERAQTLERLERLERMESNLGVDE